MDTLFQKCEQFLNNLNNFFLQMVTKNNYILEKDTEPIDYFAFRLFNGESPIENGGPEMEINGSYFLQFSTNDYLGLSKNKELRNFTTEFVKKYGITTPMGSRLLTGTTKFHNELERRIAEYKKTEDALTYAAGLNAMMGLVSAIASSNDIIIIDKLAHASLYCGAKLSGAQVKRFGHNNIDELEEILKSADPNKNKYIIVDGVYSMDGDIAPLDKICILKDKYHACLIVDDAHGNGVIGKNGRGSAEVYGVEDQIDIHAGTFSKAFGTTGGFIAAKKLVIDYLRVNSFSTVFTKAQPAVFAALTIEALEHVINGNHLREKIKNNADYLQNKLKENGFNLGNTETPITPVLFDGLNAVIIASELRKNYKIWVSPVMYPAIMVGKSLLRVIPTAYHTKEHLDYFCKCLIHVQEQIDAKANDKDKGEYNENIISTAPTA